MRVKILAKTENLLKTIYTAARTCYNPGSPVDMWDKTYSEEEMVKLIKACIKSGHLSVIEHGNFTIAIEGISRSCSHQWVRSRICAHSQQSQRYVEIKEDISLLEGISHSEENYLEQQEIVDVLDKYFVWDHKSYAQFHSLTNALYCYLYMIKSGTAPEDARQVLPNATKTNIVTTMNLRELIHVSNERLCTRAQFEIRLLVKEIVKQVIEQEAWLKEFLQPKCEQLGYCPELRGGCGRKPKKSGVLKAYETQQAQHDS